MESLSLGFSLDFMPPCPPRLPHSERLPLVINNGQMDASDIKLFAVKVMPKWMGQWDANSRWSSATMPAPARHSWPGEISAFLQY